MATSRTQELETLYEDVKNRKDTTKSHLYGFAKNVSDDIEALERSIDLTNNDAVTRGQIVAVEGELRGLRNLLKRIETDLSNV